MNSNPFNDAEISYKEKIEQLSNDLKKTEQELIELKGTLEQKVIERTVEVNKLLKDKIRFIDNLSHDLGTPLTPIITLLPIILREISDPKTKEMVETCYRNAEYLKRVVTNARELAEMSSIDLFLKKENLQEIINKMNDKYKDIFKSYNIEIENNIGSDIFIKTERNRLMQIFDHIISNSVNSMLKNGGKLVTCGATTGPRADLNLSQVFWKQLEILGSTMSNQTEFRDVMKLVFDGKLKVIIDKEFSLEDAKTAEKYLDGGNHIGKIVLKIK